MVGSQVENLVPGLPGNKVTDESVAIEVDVDATVRQSKESKKKEIN